MKSTWQMMIVAASFLLAPQPDPATGLTSARGSYDSVHGHIVSDWTRGNGHFTFLATILANNTATVYVPTKNAASATKCGKPTAQAESLKSLRMENNATVYTIGSGAYRFHSKLS